MIDDYPILVEDWSGDQAVTIVCLRCYAEAVMDPDDLMNEGLYNCPRNCGGMAIMKYELAMACKNCGTLDFNMPVDGCCSRRCALQVGYAATLQARSAA